MKSCSPLRLLPKVPIVTAFPWSGPRPKNVHMGVRVVPTDDHQGFIVTTKISDTMQKSVTGHDDVPFLRSSASIFTGRRTSTEHGTVSLVLLLQEFCCNLTKDFDGTLYDGHLSRPMIQRITQMKDVSFEESSSLTAITSHLDNFFFCLWCS